MVLTVEAVNHPSLVNSPTIVCFKTGHDSSCSFVPFLYLSKICPEKWNYFFQ